MKVLIAEDDPDSSDYLEQALESQGYEVATATNGVEALQAARRLRPDLVISDIMMPEMDGYELCRRLKQDGTLKRVPFIFYTATYTDASDQALGLSLGAVRYLRKPMDVDGILEAIVSVMEEAGAVNVPAGVVRQASTDEVEQRYSQALAKKLDKKVRELERERLALQESEAKYRRLVESLERDYIIYSQKTDGTLDYVSPSVCNVLGYSREEFQVHYTEYMTDAGVNEAAVRHTEASLQGIKQPPYDVEMRHKNGEKRLLEIVEVPIFDNDRKVVAVEGIAHDITLQRRAEEVLKRNEQSLSRAQQLSRIGHWDWDVGRDQLQWSEETRRIFGIAQDEFGGTLADFIECVHPDDQASVRQAIDRALREGSVEYDIEHRILKPDGSVHIVRELGEVSYDGRGNPLRMFGTVQDISDYPRFYRLVGHSQAMREIYRLIEKLGATPVPALIIGESGTGKELVAEALYRNWCKDEKDKPFIKVNCAALSDELLESELFGHVKGAFTGAVSNKPGRFELAHGGTIFLDEIGDISTKMQTRLLRVLQEREVERVGSTKPVKVDFNLVAATNRDLAERVRAGKFREDLYHRLKVVQLSLPPLRAHLEDLPDLLTHFLSKFNKRFDRKIKGVSTQVFEVFSRYAWPGNVRELEHTVEHAFVVCEGDIITEGDLPEELGQASSSGVGRSGSGDAEQNEREQIIRALEANRWNKVETAQALGISRRTLYRRLERLGIKA